VTSEQNQLAGVRSRQRVVLTLGNFAASDVFDQNSYAHDARTQFINWSFLTHGAYDFAADAKGYSWGATLEYVQPNWAIRAGRFLQPKESNGLALNSRIIESYYRMQWGKQQLSLGGQWIANPAYNADRGPVRLLHLRWHVDF
jgi:hypothetical protein